MLVLAALLPSQAQARRVALVIANSSYTAVSRLPNPPADARTVAKALTDAGFDQVTVESDLGKAAMDAALRNFAERADGAEVALIYYAGHGMEVDGRNYLIPIDARLRRDRDLDLEAVPLDTTLRMTEGAQRLRIVILDACRDNPFAAQMARAGATRSIGRGLARVEPNGDTLVVYAAKSGAVAADGNGGNSPFAVALARRLPEPGLEIRLLFGKVRDDVLAATGRRQEPFTYGSLSGDAFYFLPAANATAAQPSAGTTAAFDFEAEAWALCKGGRSAAPCQDYLSSYPQGRFVKLVKSRIGDFADVTRPTGTVGPALVAPVAVTLGGAAAAAIAECDRLAASPNDSERPAGVRGVSSDAVLPPLAEPACRRAVQLAPNNPRIKFQLGRALNIGANDAEARTWYEKAAVDDYAAAVNNLATYYQSGASGAQDYVKAYNLFAQAAAKGNAVAMSNLGALYLNGQGVPTDFVKARSWFEQAASMEIPDALNGLGILYRDARGVPQDYARARSLFEQAAAKGLTFAMNNLAGLYETGRGVPQDYEKARGWYERAASKGDEFSMTKLGFMYRDGRGVTMDYLQARSWFEQSAAKGEASAMSALGSFHELGQYVPQDYTKARNWYEQAAAKGDGFSMGQIGLFYAKGQGVPQDYTKARSWYEQAAAKDDVNAMTNLGVLYANGQGVTKDYAKARSWFQRAASKGSQNAKTALAKLPF